MKTSLRILGIVLGLVFLSFAAFVAWPEAIESGDFGLLDILGYGVISGYFIFYGITGESSIYQYILKYRRNPEDADT